MVYELLSDKEQLLYEMNCVKTLIYDEVVAYQVILWDDRQGYTVELAYDLR